MTAAPYRSAWVAEIELLPRDALRIVHVAARAEEAEEADAEVIAGEPLEEAVRADVVLADDEVVALLHREDLLDAPDFLAIGVVDLAADQQLDVDLGAHFENGILPTTCSRSHSSHASSGCSSTSTTMSMSISFTFDQGMR